MAAEESPRSPVLEVEGLRVSFGGLTAVNDLTFGIEQGSITGLIGPNGSGKTTAFNLISGVIRSDAGRIRLGTAGRLRPGLKNLTPAARIEVTGWPPHRIAAAGLARTYQISRIFGRMTVWENMMVGARRPPTEAAVQARELLERVNLYEKRDERGADLSYGQAKLLEIVRAMMLDPHVLLLDEPFAGVNPTMAQVVLGQLRDLRREGVTLIVIDHAMTIIMSLCDRILVMDMGYLIADGPPSKIQGNEQVLEAYFGRSAASMTP
jgi:ABC-type branched-subunit amino acid transport system ATPase component